MIAYLLVYDIPLWLISFLMLSKGEIMFMYFFIRDYVTIYSAAIFVCLCWCVSCMLCFSGEISSHHQHVFDIIKKGENEDNIAYCLSLCFDDV